MTMLHVLERADGVVRPHACLGVELFDGCCPAVFYMSSPEWLEVLYEGGADRTPRLGSRAVEGDVCFCCVLFCDFFLRAG